MEDRPRWQSQRKPPAIPPDARNATKGHNVKILRLAAVLKRVGLSRTALYDAIGAGTFPRQIKLGAKSVGWLEDEIDEWIAGRIAESRGEQ